MKRFDIMTWVMGWGIYSNSRSISKIKRTLRTLDATNQLQTKQIQHMARHLNLTMTKVNQHEEMLYEMDTKLLILNKTLQTIMIAVSHIRYETDLVNHIQARIFRLHTSLIGLKNDIDSLYDYLRALAARDLNPLIIPPDTLRKVLQDLQEELKAHPRLRLSIDPTDDIWSYYGIIKVTPIVLQDYLMLILTVPLVDQSLQLDLYRTFNLPMLHPELKVHTSYILEGEYLAIGMNGMYVALPDSSDIKICAMTTGHLCMFDQTLYPAERINWCIYALYINDQNRITRDCRFNTKVRTTNLAYSLDGYLWAVSALAAEKMQVRCVTDTRVIDINPPLQIIDVGNGCEAFSANLYIPAKSELTAVYQSLLRSQFFLQYNMKYRKISTMLVWFKMEFATLTPEEVEQFQNRVTKLGPMDMELLQQTITPPDHKYPLTIPSGLILAGLLVTGLSMAGIGIIAILKRKQIASRYAFVNQLFDKMPRLFPDHFPTPVSSGTIPPAATTKSAHRKDHTSSTYRDLEEDIIPESMKPLGQSVTSQPPPRPAPPKDTESLPPTKPDKPEDLDAVSQVSFEQFKDATIDLQKKGLKLPYYGKYLRELKNKTHSNNS